jgi:pyruvate/2-oxoglutarate dehydrogenase complex dihydrolipoamide dehydrogenase (E3) component
VDRGPRQRRIVGAGYIGLELGRLAKLGAR